MRFKGFVLMVALIIIFRPSFASTLSPASNNVLEDLSNSWEARVAPRVSAWLPDEAIRHKILATVFREATLVGVDPELVLSVIAVESHFDKYALSKAGAVGACHCRAVA